MRRSLLFSRNIPLREQTKRIASTMRCFFDISIGAEDQGRIVFELYDKEAQPPFPPPRPRTDAPRP